MRYGRHGGTFYVNFQSPRKEDFGTLGLVVRFVINVAALWVAQLVVPGFDIESVPALVFGALIFGILNAAIKPIVSVVSCPLTCLTLGFFLLIINAIMLGLTGWIAGGLGLAFIVDGFWAAFLGALVIAITSALLSTWADGAILGKREQYEDDW
ncbi:MAG TPA: phage holin family protein [Dehalococcoidia bacterium]|nr:phage holin family protein [Dehalococcoidia bacterium]